MVVVDIIQWANAELSSQGITQKLVVVGPSMGGLVTRYALRWMETNSLTHNCRLWVSFDAPHRGANIPIGSQYTLEFFAVYGENEAAKQSIADKLDAPAAKEFLIHHYAANSVAQAGAPNFRNRFNTAIENLGWPQATGLRRVSLINGSLSGILTNIPESESLGVEGKPSKFGGKFVVFLFHLGNLRVLGTDAYFTSNSSLSKRSFYGYKFKPFGGSIYYTKVAATPSGNCSVDNSPGGIYDTQQQIADQIPSEVKAQGTTIGLKILTLVPTHSFIPTKSALGSYNYTNWCDNLYTRNLVCANEIPFDNYYGPTGSSEPHVTLTYQNVQWIFNELDGTPQAAPANYSTNYPIQLLSGTEPICNSATYKVNNLPVGSSVSWSVSPSNIAAVNSTGTVTKIGNGIITLTATITNSCANFTVTKPNITVGVLPVTGTFTNAFDGSSNPLGYYPAITNAACTGYLITTNMQITGTTSVTWTKVSSSGVVNYTQNGNNISFYLFAANQNVLFQLDASNGCGTVTNQFKWLSANCGGGGGGCNGFNVSPNPASNSLKVIVPDIPPPCDGATSADSKIKASNRTITGIKIYDNAGNLRKTQVENKTKQATLNIQGFTPGAYIIEITDGIYKEKHQVIIQ